MYVPGWWQASAENLSQQKKAALSNMYVGDGYYSDMEDQDQLS